jgi:hypothetical protein
MQTKWDFAGSTDVVNIGRWLSYEGGQLERFFCIMKLQTHDSPCMPYNDYVLVAIGPY